jgi:hypothetical protein
LNLLGRERREAERHPADIIPRPSGLFLLPGQERGYQAGDPITERFEDAVAITLIADEPGSDRAVVEKAQTARLEAEAAGVTRPSVTHRVIGFAVAVPAGPAQDLGVHLVVVNEERRVAVATVTLRQ